MPSSSIDGRREPGDLLGDEDALLEPAVRELQPGHDVADGEDTGTFVRSRSSVSTKPRSMRTPASSYPRPAVDGAAADRHQQQVGLDGLAGLQGDRDPRVGVLDAGEPHARLELDPALAERALERLRAGLVLAGTSRGSASTMVTSTPNERHALANSTPITPPPRTTRRRRHAVQLERVVAGDHALAVDLEPGQGCGRRSRSRARRGGRGSAAVDLDRVRRRPAGPRPRRR